MTKSHLQNVTFQVQNKGDQSQTVSELCTLQPEYSHFNTVTMQPYEKPGYSLLVLSVFSGLDILGKGFESEGFCVVGGIDIIMDKDIRHFKPPRGRFDGLIGGSPCQDFSKLRRVPPTGYGLEMIEQFKRIVRETGVKWFLLENVPTVPDIQIEGYRVQRFFMSPLDLGYSQSRNRHFQFGSIDGLNLVFERKRYQGKTEPCLTATEGKQKNRRTWTEFCQLQGLEKIPELRDFTQSARYKLVGNGVHFGVAKAIAKAIRETTCTDNRSNYTGFDICPCGCGEMLTGKQKMKNASCRKRMQKKRETAAVNNPG